MEAIQDSLLLQFAQRLNEAMEKKGFRKHGRATALAKAFNLSTKACSKWLNGETFPSTQLQQPLASFLDVPVEWLIYGRMPIGQFQASMAINPTQDDLAGTMDIHAIRRINLQKLISQAPSQKAFAESIDTAPAYISQIVSKIPRTSGQSAEVGNNLARRIEEKLGLANGWMDSLHPSHASRSAAHIQAAPIINSIQQFDMQGLHECKQFGTTTTIHGVTYVPIVGNATMGPDGFFEPISNDNRTGDGWVRSFSKVGPFAYALRGLGDCMYPAIRSGWIPIFDPEIPPTPMGFVHVNLKDGRQTIKEFIAIQDGMLHLQAVNENKRITFNVEDVHCMAMCAALMMPWERIPDLPVVEFGNE